MSSAESTNAPPLITATSVLAVRRPVMVALDLDGTVLDSAQQLNSRIRDAVHATIVNGTTVVVVTGRMFRSALPWARELHVTAPLICYQGALIREVRVDGSTPPRTIFEDALQPSVARHAVEVARSGGWHVQAYLDDQLLCDQDRPEAHLYAAIAGVDITFVDDLVTAIGSRGSTKIACVVEDPHGAALCEDTLHRRLGEQARVTRSLPQFVEVTSPVASKGRALRRLCELRGVDPGNVVAIGDAPNDVDMLDAAGYAVAVQGAPATVAEHADALCAPPERGGVADVLIALGLTAPAADQASSGAS